MPVAIFFNQTCFYFDLIFYQKVFAPDVTFCSYRLHFVHYCYPFLSTTHFSCIPDLCLWFLLESEEILFAESAGLLDFSPFVSEINNLSIHPKRNKQGTVLLLHICGNTGDESKFKHQLIRLRIFSRKMLQPSEFCISSERFLFVVWPFKKLHFVEMVLEIQYYFLSAFVFFIGDLNSPCPLCLSSLNRQS